MLCTTHAMGPGGAYVLLALGIVIGAAGVAAIIIARRAIAERERLKYFSDVRTLARGGR